MHKLIKYMKPYALNILLVVLLLFVQANADLALPSYMSDIVDNGIQGSGIRDTVPKALTNETYNMLIGVSNREDAESIESSYKKTRALDISYTERTDKFNPDSEVYVLNDISESEKKKVERIFFTNIIEKMSEDTEGLSESMKEKVMGYFTKTEYEKLEIDIDSIQMKYLFKTGGKMLGIALLGMASAVVVVLLSARTAAGLGRDLRDKTFRKVMNFSNVEIDKFSIASLVNRSTNDIQQIQLFLVMFLRLVFYAPILGIGGVIKVLNTSSNMVWIVGVALLAISVVVLIIFSLAVPKFKKVQKLLDRIALIARESLTGMMVVRSFNNQKFQEERFEKENRELTGTTMFIGKLMGTMMPLMMFIMNITTIGIVWYGAQQIDLGNLEIGDMMAFIQYSMQIIMSFLLISMVSVMLPRSSVAATRVVEILETDYTICDSENPVEFDSSLKGNIEFRDVSFRYPGAEQNVLCNIDFSADSGDTVAIIGGTGSGKSSIIKLMNRFYDVSEGSIIIDGKDIRDVKQSDLRNKIGYVPQKAFLFSGTIESNIKYSDENMSFENMVEAAETSQSTEFIDQKEEKYNSPIVAGGGNVSGGQRQRLSIARAIAKNPEIIIFDDSFSALDFKTEKTVKQELEKNLKDVTKIIIAQRISSIQDADTILVLDSGRVVGKGKHKDLINNCEVYREIALSQLSKEELGYEQ